MLRAAALLALAAPSEGGTYCFSMRGGGGCTGAVQETVTVQDDACWSSAVAPQPGWLYGITTAGEMSGDIGMCSSPTQSECEGTALPYMVTYGAAACTNQQCTCSASVNSAGDCYNSGSASSYCFAPDVVDASSNCLKFFGSQYLTYVDGACPSPPPPPSRPPGEALTEKHPLAPVIIGSVCGLLAVVMLIAAGLMCYTHRLGYETDKSVAAQSDNPALDVYEC